MNSKHNVIVTLQAKPDMQQELLEALLHVKNLSQKEDACHEYRVYQDKQDPNQFVLYENWTSEQEHAKQFEKPYILALGKKLEDLLAKPFSAIFSQEKV